jgi:protein O-mannosyl-transferase
VNVFNTKIKISQKIFIFLILSIVTILYLKTASYQLIFLDDDTLIFEKFKDRTFIEKVEHAFTWNYLDGQYYRPVTLIIFILEEEIGNKSLFIYHLTNFLIHLFTSLFLFLVLNNIGYKIFTSFIAALLFSVSPIHINAIGWIAGRGDLLAGFFSILGFYIFLKYIKQSEFKLIPLIILLQLAQYFQKKLQ